jgi:hypothetical protein
VISILLAIYLLVPAFNFEDQPYFGSQFYSPYQDWSQSPMQTIEIKNDSLIGIRSGKVLHLNPFLEKAHLVSIDTMSRAHFSPFLLGHSINDAQYLVKNRTQNEYVAFILGDEQNPFYNQVSGVNISILESIDAVKQIDAKLKKGNPTAIINGANDSLFTYNLVMSLNGYESEILTSLAEGRNLLAFSNKEIFDADIDQIPVIRNIEWEENKLSIDLSEKGTIKIISSGFELDTLSSNLSIKLNSPKWFRFEVRFEEEQITYLSNPFFSYAKQPFSTVYPKTNNQLTIFINLSWLLGIVLLNLLLNKLRTRYF